MKSPIRFFLLPFLIMTLYSLPSKAAPNFWGRCGRFFAKRVIPLVDPLKGSIKSRRFALESFLYWNPGLVLYRDFLEGFTDITREWSKFPTWIFVKELPGRTMSLKISQDNGRVHGSKEGQSLYPFILTISGEPIESFKETLSYVADQLGVNVVQLKTLQTLPFLDQMGSIKVFSSVVPLEEFVKVARFLERVIDSASRHK